MKIILMLILAVACSACQRSAPPHAAKPITVTLAYTSQHDCALVHLALAKGFFTQEGLVVQPQLHAFGKSALDALREEKADLATCAETPFVFAALNNEPLAIVTSIFSSTSNNAIVANRSRGISSAGDLRGKRIGYTAGTTSEFYLDTLLSVNDLLRSEITAVNLTPDAMADAIRTDRVDAVCTWNPNLSLIFNNLGAHAIRFFDNDIYSERFVLAGRRAYLQGNADTVNRVLRALIAAEQFAGEQPGEAQKIVAATMKIDPILLQSLWKEGEFRVLLDQRLLITLEDESQWAIKKRLTAATTTPNYLEYIYPDGLASVKPSALRIQR